MNTEIEGKSVDVKRWERYKEIIDENPKRATILQVKNGRATFKEKKEICVCSEIEGYIKLPSSDEMVRLSATDMEFQIHFLPRFKILFCNEEGVYSLGYKTENCKNIFVFLRFIVNETDYLLFATGKDDFPLLISEEEFPLQEEGVNYSTFKIIEKLLLGNQNEQDEVSESEDEWDE